MKNCSLRRLVGNEMGGYRITIDHRFDVRWRSFATISTTQTHSQRRFPGCSGTLLNESIWKKIRCWKHTSQSGVLSLLVDTAHPILPPEKFLASRLLLPDKNNFLSRAVSQNVQNMSMNCSNIWPKSNFLQTLQLLKILRHPRKFYKPLSQLWYGEK